MAGRFSNYAIECYLEKFFRNNHTRHNFAGSADWPPALYLGLATDVNVSDPDTIVVAGSASHVEPDCDATNISNGYGRVNVSPGDNSGYAWAMKNGDVGVLVNNKAFSFEHTQAAAGNITCATEMVAATLPWGYCNGTSWIPLSFRYFFICETATSGARAGTTNVICYGALATEKTIYPGDRLTFDIGAIEIDLTTCV